MSKEIKFRAWIEDIGEMVYGDEEYHFIVYSDGQVDYTSNDIEAANWGREQLKVMQFTGLRDKDGREVYEGDIVRISDGDDWEIGMDEIVYNAPCFEFKKDNGLQIDSRIVEVIGNVFENPNLLNPPTQEIK